MVLKTNYHTHTPRCQHAAGSEEEYVLSAIEAGFDTLGFADHTPWNYKDYVSRIRMRADELEGYIKAVREQGERHKDRIRVLCGLECEYFPAYISWLREFKEEQGLDYIILGNHFSPSDDGGQYVVTRLCICDKKKDIAILRFDTEPGVEPLELDGESLG